MSVGPGPEPQGPSRRARAAGPGAGRRAGLVWPGLTRRSRSDRVDTDGGTATDETREVQVSEEKRSGCCWRASGRRAKGCLGLGSRPKGRPSKGPAGTGRRRPCVSMTPRSLGHRVASALQDKLESKMVGLRLRTGCSEFWNHDNNMREKLGKESCASRVLSCANNRLEQKYLLREFRSKIYV